MTPLIPIDGHNQSPLDVELELRQYPFRYLRQGE